MEKSNEKLTASEIASTTFSNVSISGTFYNHDKYATPRGHGFAAEDANHQYDLLHGKNAQLVGADNAKNGADRIVNGQYIQTKFYSSGSKSIAAAFDNGKMKYIDPTGKPMQIEVAADAYDGAVQAMENRIKSGQVPGVSDPAEATNIVRKSPYTYEQVKNIAKAGNIDSIKFDTVNGAIISVSAFGISSVLTFATSVWNGDDFDLALKNGVKSGLKVGGISFATSIIASQLSKAGLNSALVGSSDAIVNIMGPKASAFLVNAFRSGNNIYGAAAMKSASKLLRGNIITGVVTGLVLETVDFVNIFQGRISGKQLFKNVTNTAAGIAGGTAGWIGGTTAAGATGAAIGSVVPVLGTVIGGAVGSAIGGIAGALGGGAAATAITNTTLGVFIEDDANKMVEIIQRRFSVLATDYLLSEKEAKSVVEKLQMSISGGTLKDMYAYPNHEGFADNLLFPIIENATSARKKITTPTNEEMLDSMRELFEDVSDDKIRAGENEIYSFYDEAIQSLFLTNAPEAIENSLKIKRYLPIGTFIKDDLTNLYGLIDMKTKDFSILSSENEAKKLAFDLVSTGNTKKSDLKILVPEVKWFDEVSSTSDKKTWYSKINAEQHKCSFSQQYIEGATEFELDIEHPLFVVDYVNQTFYSFTDEILAKSKVFELVNEFDLSKENFEIVVG